MCTSFEVFTALLLQIQVFCDVTLCRSVSSSPRFDGSNASTFRIKQPRRIPLNCLFLTMAALRNIGTTHPITQRHKPQDDSSSHLCYWNYSRWWKFWNVIGSFPVVTACSFLAFPNPRANVLWSVAGLLNVHVLTASLPLFFIYFQPVHLLLWRAYKTIAHLPNFAYMYVENNSANATLKSDMVTLVHDVYNNVNKVTK
jgi:hypothetical protein